MAFHRNRGSPRGSSSNNNKNQGSGTSRNNRSRYFRNNKPEFKFGLHDSQRKGSYTSAKITEAIITKIQKEFEGGRLIANSLRNKVKAGPTLPTLKQSAKVNQDEKDAENKSFQCQFDAQMKHYFTIEERFENEWVRAYSLIYDSYCTSDLKVAIKEEPDFESRIRDDPVELLKEVERLGSIPR